MKQSLADRYNLEFMQKADERRNRLDYKPLHVGAGESSRIERVKRTGQSPENGRERDSPQKGTEPRDLNPIYSFAENVLK